MLRRVSKWFCPFAFLAVWGCGPSDKTPKLPDLVPVSGTVTYDGKPLTDAMVQFLPMGSTQGQGTAAVTDASGKYTLETVSSNGKARPGAVPGNYGVRISRMVKPDGSVWKPGPDASGGPATSGAREEMPDEYAMQSKLTAEVSKDKPVHDFKLDKKK